MSPERIGPREKILYDADRVSSFYDQIVTAVMANGGSGIEAHAEATEACKRRQEFIVAFIGPLAKHDDEEAMSRHTLAGPGDLVVMAVLQKLGGEVKVTDAEVEAMPRLYQGWNYSRDPETGVATIQGIPAE